MLRAGVTTQWLEQRLLIVFVVISGGVLVVGIEFFSMFWRIGDQSEVCRYIYMDR